MRLEMISLSICVPAYNEEESLKRTIEELISHLKSVGIDFEILLINDGSTDSTLLIAEELCKANPEIKIFSHGKNSGIGVCFRTALNNATRPYFTWFPADGENFPDELINSIKFLNEKVIVTSHHLGCDPRPLVRKIISRFYTSVLNLRFNLNINYYNGLTIFPTSVLKDMRLKCKGFGIFAESIIKILRAGYKIIELNYPLKKRKAGKSKAFGINSLISTLKELVYLTVIMPFE